MKTILILSALVAATIAATLPEVVPILHQESEVGADGRYDSRFETGNGIKQEEHGVQKNPGTKDASSEVVGQVEYISPEGIPVYLKYIANEFGFQPEGNLLPVPPVDTNTPPPIPEAILRSIEYNKAHPEENEPENAKTYRQ